MAIFIDEYFKSRPTTESDDPKIDLIYKIVTTPPTIGSKNEDIDIKAALLNGGVGTITASTGDLGAGISGGAFNGFPRTYDGLFFESYNLTPETTGVWTATVHYTDTKREEEGDTEIRITTTGGTHHITNSIDTVGTYKAPNEEAPDVQGIEDQGKGRVAGVDVQIPAFGYSVKTWFDPADVTAAYIKLLYLQTATVNNAAFKLFAKGEALFLGATLVQKSSQRLIEASFEFVGSVNADGILQDKLIVGDILNIVKLGHEYLWTRYRTDKDAAAKTLIEKPIAAYVEQVYEFSDFSKFKIGI